MMLRKKMLLKTDEHEKREACRLPSRLFCIVSFYLVFSAIRCSFCGTVVFKREDKNCGLKNNRFTVSALAGSCTFILIKVCCTHDYDSVYVLCTLCQSSLLRGVALF